MLQLWLRLSQVLQHDSTWSEQLDEIATMLEGEMSQSEFAAQVKKARNALHHQIDEFVNGIDLYADLLTGIENRRGLEAVLEMFLAMHKRYGQPFSLVAVTIDQYDRIRDACGDNAVKPLLKAVARIIQQAIRTSDYVARCRDDVFAAVLTNTDLQGAEIFCQRLRKMAKHDTELDVSLRIGTRAVSPETGDTVESLIRRAEI
jgi:diguanylate cyclase (GGDEF)-like protein